MTSSQSEEVGPSSDTSILTLEPRLVDKLNYLGECYPEYMNLTRTAQQEQDPNYPQFKVPGMNIVATMLGFHKGELDLYGRHQLRYDIYLNLWNKMVTEYLLLDDFHREPNETANESSSSKIPHRTSEDNDGLRLFRVRWGLWSIEPHEFAAIIDYVVNFKDRNPSPLLQSLTFRDLPVELVREVYSHLRLRSVMVLSSVSKYFQEAGKPFTFRSRKLILAYPKESPILLGDVSPSLSDKLRVPAAEAHEAYLDQIKFLESRPNILTYIRVLSIHDQWAHRMTYSERALSTHHALFKGAISRDICNLLNNTANLNTLKLRSFIISKEVIECIDALEAIHTLHLLSCVLGDDARDLLELAGSAHPRTTFCSTIHNLIVESTIGTLTQFHLPCFLPNLRNLSIEPLPSEYEYGVWLPETSLMRKWPVFATLKRVSFFGLQPQQIQEVAAWTETSIRHGVQVGISGNHREPNNFVMSSNLTHFKVHFANPIGKLDVLRMLSGFCSTPNLEVCSIHGIGWRDAHPVIVGAIVVVLPSLKHLTLSIFRYEEAGRSKSPFPVPIRNIKWPEPAWEYARYFQYFEGLESFTWDNRGEASYSPVTMLRFETDDLGDDGNGDDKFDSNFPDDKFDEDGSDSYGYNSTVAVFAARCKTLQTFTILGDHLWDTRTYTIERIQEPGYSGFEMDYEESVPGYVREGGESWNVGSGSI
ncbi:hypothetical protein FRC17_000118 [Serendipita sp. 399]|nr:hypothetical protein FRC17_000118 [Serendipita sp. 399]